MNKKEYDSLVDIDEKVHDGLKNADAQGLYHALNSLVELSQKLLRKYPETKDTELRGFIESQLQDTIGALAMLLYWKGRPIETPPEKHAKSMYSKPLVFRKKWIGANIVSYGDGVFKDHEAKQYALKIIEKYPNIKKSELDREVAKKFKIRKSRSNAIVSEIFEERLKKK